MGSPYDYIIDESTLVKTKGEWPTLHCSATVTCNRCKKKKTLLRFDMDDPSYESENLMGMYFGYSMHLCMWYNGYLTEKEKGWGQDSDGIYCPECWPKITEGYERERFSMQRWDYVWDKVDQFTEWILSRFKRGVQQWEDEEEAPRKVNSTRLPLHRKEYLW